MNYTGDRVSQIPVVFNTDYHQHPHNIIFIDENVVRYVMLQCTFYGPVLFQQQVQSATQPPWSYYAMIGAPRAWRGPECALIAA
jgi:hypothetical protein